MEGGRENYIKVPKEDIGMVRVAPFTIEQRFLSDEDWFFVVFLLAEIGCRYVEVAEMLPMV